MRATHGWVSERMMAGRQAGGQQQRGRGVCAVTGASGYVGSRIARHLARVGWEVRALCRSKPALEEVAHVPFDLDGELAAQAIQGADALVHAAYDFGHTRWSDITRVNIDGSRRLFVAAQEANVERIICVSTVAAYPGARSMYGQAKLAIERAAIDAGAAVVRSGLVWGPHGAAMFGSLRQAIERLPAVPLVVPADLPVTLAHEDDLASFYGRLLERWPDGAGRLFVAASEEVLSFGELLRLLSLQVGRRRLFVRVPWRPLWVCLRMLERLGTTLAFPSDRLLSLATIDREPFAHAGARTEPYGVVFRPYRLT